MNECQLEKISQDIGTLTKLQTLELGINKLKVVPRQIGTRLDFILKNDVHATEKSEPADNDPGELLQRLVAKLMPLRVYLLPFWLLSRCQFFPSTPTKSI